MSGWEARQSRRWANMADIRTTRAVYQYRPSVQLILRYLINSCANRAYRQFKRAWIFKRTRHSDGSINRLILINCFLTKNNPQINDDCVYAKTQFVSSYFRMNSVSSQTVLVRDKHVHNLRLRIGTNGTCNNQSCGPVYIEGYVARYRRQVLSLEDSAHRQCRLPICNSIMTSGERHYHCRVLFARQPQAPSLYP